MNSLLVFPGEIHSEQVAIMTGARADYINQWHDLQPGQQQKILFFKEGMGTGEVLECSPNRIEIKILDYRADEMPPRMPLSLVIATPRPQTVKKVLETAASLGFQDVTFIRSERGVRSYLSSKVFTPAQLATHIHRGMEQACDPVAPTCSVYDMSLVAYCKSKLSMLQETTNNLFLVADTSEDSLSLTAVLESKCSQDSHLSLFIGPEAGWADSERAYLSSQDVFSVSLGDRMLRVETALAVACGEIQNYYNRTFQLQVAANS